ncbi:type III secretion protein [Burkholderia lata]|uniref:type III secretion protein n=1 Tax=Burkholderia lata (strain ATCC 17760 / DSM 23089 / LMG 22485 / NCIMB 9086 / R18194 / 383) TaxID=482957 RepID=UPI0015841045|nr:type III secretion protein [Burkholderia lata]
MLKQLLAIKRRREGGLRAGLAWLADDDRQLCSKQEALQMRRDVLHAEWRALAAQSGCVDRRSFSTLRANLAKFEAEDQALRHQKVALTTKRTQLAQALAEKEAHLHRNLREQEKFSLILENL